MTDIASARGTRIPPAAMAAAAAVVALAIFTPAANAAKFFDRSFPTAVGPG